MNDQTRVYLSRFVTLLFLFYPIYNIPYFQSLGFSLAEIGFLMGTVSLFGIIMEVPTGIFADKQGRKISTITGYLLTSVGLFGIFFTTNYYIILLFHALLGTAMTFVSGAMDAWISDSFPDKEKVFAKENMSGEVGALLSGFIGVFFVTNFGIASIWWISGIGFLIGAFLLAFNTEKRKKMKESYVLHLKESVMYVFSKFNLTIFLISGLFMGFALSFTTGLIWLPYLENIGYSSSYFGYIWSGMAVMGFLAGWISLKQNMKHINLMILGMVLWIFTLFSVYYITNVIYAVIALLLTVLFSFMMVPSQKAYFQDLLEKKKRATIGSFESMLMSIAGVIGFPTAGFLADAITPKLTLVISGFLLTPVLITYIILKKID